MDPKFILDRLINKGVSISQIAEMMNLEYSTLEKIQKGITKDPLTSTTRRLEELFMLIFMRKNKKIVQG